MNENSFNPTLKLKSSPKPFNFFPFNINDDTCSYCKNKYTSINQKYCKNCLQKYINDVIKDITDDNTYLDVHINTDYGSCQEHQASRSRKFHTQDIKEWCNKCSTIIFKQIPTRYWKLRSDYYLISFEWIESLNKKKILVLNLPWWDNFDECLICKLKLKFKSNCQKCQKWCTRCHIFYTGCRYCLTTNIIFGSSDQSQCRKCKRILTIDIDIKDVSSGSDDIDAFLFKTGFNFSSNHKIANHIIDYINSIINNVDHIKPSEIYDSIKKTCINNINKSVHPESVMEWIPYSQITNLKKIAEGGFGIVYKANWSDGGIHGVSASYERIQNETVAVKRLKDSQKIKNITKKILNELKSHHKCYKFGRILRCYGITKDPNTDEYMLLMEYAEKGNLRDYLQKNFVKIEWKRKIEFLWEISEGLLTIHKANFIHRDFHSGNILLGVGSSRYWQIGDLGLSQSANNTSLNDEIYGIIPYVAPEILNGSKFNVKKKSDIYSLGMIMWECTTGCKPFADVEHDVNLMYSIIDGKRPEITKDTPECFANLMKSCWESDPTKRSSIGEVCETLSLWCFKNENVEQFNQAEKKRLELIQHKMLGPEFTRKPHPKAIYTGRIIPRSSSTSNSTFNIKRDTNKVGAFIERSNNKEYITREYNLDINNIQRTYHHKRM